MGIIVGDGGAGTPLTGFKVGDGASGVEVQRITLGDGGAGRVVWEAWTPRIVTVEAAASYWYWGGVEDETGLLDRAESAHLYFTAPVVSDRATANYPAGYVIPAGNRTGSPRDGSGTYTFTEVRP